MKNIFYFSHINVIGGIESFFYYLAKKYQNWDITIYYKTGDINQIKRLKQYVRVKKYKGEHIVCDKAFFNFNLDIIDNVDAKEYIQIAHGDYKAMGIMPNTHPKITKYLGVSKQVCDTYKEITGFDTELVYNPVEIDTPKKVLNLISATRLTKEKGKDRIIKLSKILDDANIPYLWTIFTNDVNKINNPNIIYMKPRLDITNYIANADYLVQLSDNEGYCYSVIESLLVGTPVIVTECPVFKELGVINGENGFILDFKLKNIPINDIYDKKLKFEYKPKESNWEKFLEKGKSTYEEEKNMRVKVKCIRTAGYTDLELNRHINFNEEFEVEEERAEFLKNHNAVEIIGVVKNKKESENPFETYFESEEVKELEKTPEILVDTNKKTKKKSKKMDK